MDDSVVVVVVVVVFEKKKWGSDLVNLVFSTNDIR